MASYFLDEFNLRDRTWRDLQDGVPESAFRRGYLAWRALNFISWSQHPQHRNPSDHFGVSSSMAVGWASRWPSPPMCRLLTTWPVLSGTR